MKKPSFVWPFGTEKPRFVLGGLLGWTNLIFVKEREFLFLNEIALKNTSSLDLNEPDLKLKEHQILDLDEPDFRRRTLKTWILVYGFSGLRVFSR
ncbi:unnamed protein product [Rhizophagus irregularis]|nr:unnamed protein product [Rhizophagus irregularis]